MAERRMFTKKITESDAFLDMPMSTQCLYFHLNMSADDDGFINNPKRIMRLIGANEDDLKLLLMKSFVIAFDSGVIVIKHWKMHNYIQSDRYKPTDYIEEKEMLSLKQNKAYTLNSDMDTKCIQDVSVGKDRLGKDRLGKVKEERHKYGEYKNVLLSDEDLGKLKAEFPKDWEERIEKLSFYIKSTGKTYKDHLATIRNWARKERQTEPKTKVVKKNSFNSFEQHDYDFEAIERMLNDAQS